MHGKCTHLFCCDVCFNKINHKEKLTSFSIEFNFFYFIRLFFIFYFKFVKFFSLVLLHFKTSWLKFFVFLLFLSVFFLFDFCYFFVMGVGWHAFYLRPQSLPCLRLITTTYFQPNVAFTVIFFFFFWTDDSLLFLRESHISVIWTNICLFSVSFFFYSVTFTLSFIYLFIHLFTYTFCTFIFTRHIRVGWKVHWLKSSYDDVIFAVDFLRIGSKHYNTNGRRVWTTRGIMLKNKLYFVRFNESILVGVWTFRPTLVY